MQKNTLLSIIIGLVVIGGAFLAVFGSSLKNLKQEPSQTTITVEQDVPLVTEPVSKPAPSETVPAPKSVVAPTKPTVSPSPQPVPVVSGYTLTDVAVHNSATSCWSAINGKVYDLTNWVNSHPGGKATILMICGKDGSPLFNAQHGGKNKIADILTKYLIGPLN